MLHRQNTNTARKNAMKGVELYEGYSLVEQLRNMKQNGEKPMVMHEMIYTEKKHGVIDSYNIRADRFAIGQENAEKISKYKNAKEMRNNGIASEQAEDAKTIEVKQNTETENH